MYILRLDDASDYMDRNKWDRMEQLLEKYHVKPIVGVIPDNQDPNLVKPNQWNPDFWEKVHRWQDKGWSIAMHGCRHRFISNKGGVNPVNQYSEFAGISLEEQTRMVQTGISILKSHGVTPQIFFAPAHTFDLNTLEALKSGSEIRIISDTVANNQYFENDMYFIPQQAGQVRPLPFKLVTFCYHPNQMEPSDFINLERFLKKNRKKFGSFQELQLKKRKKTLYDRLLMRWYFLFRRYRTTRIFRIQR